MIHIMAREIASFDQTWWRVWWWYRSHIIMMIGTVRGEWDYDKQCSEHIHIMIRYPILGHEYQTIYKSSVKCLICSSEDMKCEVRAWWAALTKSVTMNNVEQSGAHLTELSRLLSPVCPHQLAPIIRFLCEILLSGAGRGGARSVAGSSAHVPCSQSSGVTREQAQGTQ